MFWILEQAAANTLMGVPERLGLEECPPPSALVDTCMDM